MNTVSKHGKGSRYYGQLMTASLPNEVKTIWYSRDDELPELPKKGWSWQMQDSLDQVEHRELLIKILEDAPLTDRHALVVELYVIQEHTLEEIGKRLGIGAERVRQIYMQAMRKLRQHQLKITGAKVDPLDCGVTTWWQWKWSKQCM